MAKTHRYALSVAWTGNRGSGTSAYRDYDRNHAISAPGKASIIGSSDPAFLGDASAWNPEELLVASISACHQLWYLHLAAEAGIIVTAYHDDPAGEMTETPDGGGHFTGVTLRPRVTITRADMVEAANALHHRAHELCFIARSVNFAIACEPETVAA